VVLDGLRQQRVGQAVAAGDVSGRCVSMTHAPRPARAPGLRRGVHSSMPAGPRCSGHVPSSKPTPTARRSVAAVLHSGTG